MSSIEKSSNPNLEDDVDYGDIELNKLFKSLKYYNDNELKIHNYFTNLFHNQDTFFVEKTIPYFIFINLSK